MPRSTLARRFIPYFACLKRLLVLVWGLGFEQSAPCGFKCAVNGDAADLVAAYQGGDAFLPLRVGQPNGLAVVRGETGVFVHVHVSVFSWKYCKQRY